MNKRSIWMVNKKNKISRGILQLKKHLQYLKWHSAIALSSYSVTAQVELILHTFVCLFVYFSVS